jgi:hypothetical protein
MMRDTMQTKLHTCQLCEATSAGTNVRFPSTRSALCTWCRDELKRTARGWCPQCASAHPLPAMQGGYCKPCKRERNKEYYAANASQERARKRIYRQTHPSPPRTPEQRRAYYARHRAHVLANHRRWYQENAEFARAQARAYRRAALAKNPAYWRERVQRQKVRMWRRVIGR